MKVAPINSFNYYKNNFKSQKTTANCIKPIKTDSVSFSRKSVASLRFDSKSDTIYSLFPDGVEKYSLEDKLNTFGIETALDEDNKLIITEYRQPTSDISFEDIGVDENELLNNISLIIGNADFTGSKATSLGSVKAILGNIILKNHQISDLGKLAHIGGERICDDSNFDLYFDLNYSVW